MPAVQHSRRREPRAKPGKPALWIVFPGRPIQAVYAWRIVTLGAASQCFTKPCVRTTGLTACPAREPESLRDNFDEKVREREKVIMSLSLKLLRPAEIPSSGVDDSFFLRARHLQNWWKPSAEKSAG